MSPAAFHIHLDNCQCVFQNLEINCRHAVYKNTKTGKKFTIPKDCEFLALELMVLCCDYLDIEYPYEVTEQLAIFNGGATEKKGDENA